MSLRPLANFASIAVISDVKSTDRIAAFVFGLDCSRPRHIHVRMLITVLKGDNLNQNIKLEPGDTVVFP